MKKLISATVITLATTALAGVVPEVSNVTFTQPPNSRRVTITYDLGAAPAIIAVDICTNGVSIGDANLQYFSGDVFKLVTNQTANATETHTIYWQPQKAWPNHEIKDGSVTARVYAWPVDNPPDYMVVDLIVPSDVRYYPSADCLPGGLLENLDYRLNKLVMRRIHAAGIQWRRGSSDTEIGHQSNETLHNVTLSSDYYMGVFEMTQSQWTRLTTLPQQYFTNATCAAMRPVDQISYNRVRCSDGNDVKGGLWPNDPYEGSFLDLLRKHSGGIAFDLPSESQWEYACRADHYDGFWNDGSAIKNSQWNDSNLNRLARYAKSTADRNCMTDDGTAIVGSYAPNSWGLYDMHGNVYEWCLDWYAADVESLNGDVNVDTANPSAARIGSATARVFRGGAWTRVHAWQLRSAARSSQDPQIANYSNYGLRVVCPVPAK